MSQQPNTNNTNNTNIPATPPPVIIKRKVIKNLCMVCGVDIGESNPRQLCGKTYCLNESEDTTDSDD